jgi:hypothetical protein
VSTSSSYESKQIMRGRLARERVAKRGPGAGQPRHHRAHRDVHHLGQLPVRQPLQLAEPEQLARPSGQLAHRPRNARRVIGLEQQCLGRGRRLEMAVRLLVEGVGHGQALTAVPAEARVADDTEEPGAPVAAREGGEVSKGAKRCLLHDVVGVVVVAHHPTGQPAAGLEVRHHDGVESGVDRHAASLERPSAGHHAQDPYDARTPKVRSTIMAVAARGRLARTSGNCARPPASRRRSWQRLPPCQVHAISALERGERRRPAYGHGARAVGGAGTGAGRARRVRRELAIAVADPAVDELGAPPLPIPPTDLVGREDDVRCFASGSRIRQRASSRLSVRRRGKSRLALELARASPRTARPGRLSCRWRRSETPGSSRARLPRGSGWRTSARRICRRARARRAPDGPTLIVLDNFEQVLVASSVVSALVGSVPSLQLLVTSRTPLRVRGEREYALGPLALTGGRRSGRQRPRGVPAVRLFVERRATSSATFQLTASNGSTVLAICRRLDALPLALELTARWIKVLPPAELLQRLERNVLASTPGPRDLPSASRR